MGCVPDSRGGISPPTCADRPHKTDLECCFKRKIKKISNISNLASEPIVRAVKSGINMGYNILGVTVKTTAYADDIAIITKSPSNTQAILDKIDYTAKRLGLTFNPGKCASLILNNGIAVGHGLKMNSGNVRIKVCIW